MMEAWEDDDFTLSGLTQEAKENYSIEDVSDDDKPFNGLILPAKSVANLSGNIQSDFDSHITSIMETQISNEEDAISVDSYEFDMQNSESNITVSSTMPVLTPQVISTYFIIC